MSTTGWWTPVVVEGVQFIIFIMHQPNSTFLDKHLCIGSFIHSCYYWTTGSTSWANAVPLLKDEITRTLTWNSLGGLKTMERETCRPFLHVPPTLICYGYFSFFPFCRCICCCCQAYSIWYLWRCSEGSQCDRPGWACRQSCPVCRGHRTRAHKQRHHGERHAGM